MNISFADREKSSPEVCIFGIQEGRSRPIFSLTALESFLGVRALIKGQRVMLAPVVELVKVKAYTV